MKNPTENLDQIPEEHPEKPPEPEVKGYTVKGIPHLDFYRKTYARSCGDNDEKAVKIFKEFENQDRVKRVKAELIAISKGNVSPTLCEKVLGKVRSVKYESWQKWAAMMIGAINSKR